MEKQELQASLQALHQQLSTLENVDESTKELLATVMQDILLLLQGKPTAEQLSEDRPQPNSETLRGMMDEFEAEHPKLAQTLGQVADALANLGI